MVKPASWGRIVIGLTLGAVVSFLIGCIYAYAVWNPPSNDWGNEKTSTTLLLAPVFLLGLVLVFFARKPIRRCFVQLPRIGWTGFLAALVGAAVLPAWQLGSGDVERLRVPSTLDAERQANLAKLAEIGVRLRQADAVVLENQTWMTPQDRDRLTVRLAAFTNKPVFAVKPNPDRQQPQQLHKYQTVTGPACPTAVAPGDSCLTSEIADFDDWPTTGLLFYIDQDLRLTDAGKELYADVALTALEKPSEALKSPYTLPYDPGVGVRDAWTNSCSIKNYGLFPFGRGVHWKICADPLNLQNMTDQIFALNPLSGR